MSGPRVFDPRVSKTRKRRGFYPQRYVTPENLKDLAYLGSIQNCDLELCAVQKEVGRGLVTNLSATLSLHIFATDRPPAPRGLQPLSRASSRPRQPLGVLDEFIFPAALGDHPRC